jgi:hypothetical protein
MAAADGKTAFQRAVDRRLLPKGAGLVAPIPRLEAEALRYGLNAARSK